MNPKLSPTLPISLFIKKEAPIIIMKARKTSKKKIIDFAKVNLVNSLDSSKSPVFTLVIDIENRYN